jgi:amidase
MPSKSSMNRSELLALSAVGQARLIRERQIGSLELIDAYLARIEEINPTLNAVTEVLAECARAAARKADKSSPIGLLHGVPFSIKDSIEVAGTVATAGTIGRRAAELSTADATLVARLRAAGAIPIAKTNLPDLLFAFESENLIFGRTNNPYDHARTSGGSSGGEAALIAACGSPMGLGSDCAGSVRLPAAFCGIAGIKPTSGRLPRTGHFPPSGGWIEALWQIGPMARRTEDLIAMMELLAGPDFADHSVVDLPFTPLPPDRAAELRIAWYCDNGFAAPDNEVAGVVRAAAAALDAEEASLACIASAYDLEMKLLGADGGDSLRAYAAGLGSARLHPLLSGWLDKLEAYRTDLAGLQSYWAEWDAYRANLTAFLRGYDAIVCPVYTHAALPHGTSIRDDNFRGFSHTMAYNLAGLPAAVVRCGESAAGLPIAVQVVARAWREDAALAVAARLEREFGGWKPAPPSTGLD